MNFSLLDLRPLGQYTHDFRKQLDSEGSKITSVPFVVIENKITIAISQAIVISRQEGYLDLDKESFLNLTRTLAKADPKLFSAVRKAIFLQSQKEVFED